ncbi:hypothetical protein K461DRAFT_325006 [Myriangium duriaei CBS 260.36]|uniref:Rhodopsin domain-containing protein n=1 Tax=Myriangium duriaei CBS 260.36 TaxID=1168546 RepID=A0A9P4MBX0_9PEZI|nr:hypothetical protein K461DRAFT_325006 [Myriangium duriaei CBS 260.36]
MGVSWSLGILGLLTTFIRHRYASKTPNGKLRWDYVFACATAKCALAALVMLTFAVAHGLGNDMWALHYSDLTDAIFYTFMSLAAGTIAIIFAKLSVVALLLQIEDGLQRKRRKALFLIAAVFTTANLLVLPANFTRCTPTRKIWDPLVPGTCNFNFSRYTGMMQSYVTGITDFILALWPISFVVQITHNSLKTKIKIVVLMSMATLPGILGVLRAKQLENNTIYMNFTRNFSEFILFGSLELGLIVILTSVPVLASQFGHKWDKIMARSRSLSTEPIVRMEGPDDLAARQCEDSSSEHLTEPPQVNMHDLDATVSSRSQFVKSHRLEESSMLNTTSQDFARQSFLSGTLNALAYVMGQTKENSSEDNSSQHSDALQVV